MRVPSGSEILGYPAIAMLCFLVAVIGGAALSVWIVVSDRRIASKARRAKATGTPPR